MAHLTDDQLVQKIRKSCLEDADGLSGGLDLDELKAIARGLNLSDKGNRKELCQALSRQLYPDQVEKIKQTWEDWLTEQPTEVTKPVPKKVKITKAKAKPQRKPAAAIPSYDGQLTAIKPGAAARDIHGRNAKALTKEIIANVKTLEQQNGIDKDSAFTTVFRYRFPKAKQSRDVSDNYQRYYPYGQETGATPIVSLVRGYMIVPNKDQIKLFPNSVMEGLSKAFPDYIFAERYSAGGKPIKDPETGKRNGSTIGHNEIVIVGDLDKWQQYVDKDLARKGRRDTNKEMEQTYVYSKAQKRNKSEPVVAAPAQLPANINLASLAQFPSL